MGKWVQEEPLEEGSPCHMGPGWWLRWSSLVVNRSSVAPADCKRCCYGFNSQLALGPLRVMKQQSRSMCLDPLLSNSVTLCPNRVSKLKGRVCAALSMGHCTKKFTCNYLKRVG